MVIIRTTDMEFDNEIGMARKEHEKTDIEVDTIRMKTDKEVDVADMECEMTDTDFDTADLECSKLPHMEWLKLFLEFA